MSEHDASPGRGGERWFTWKRSVLLIMGLVFISLCVIWFAATVSANRSLAATVARYHAAGEPIEAKDFELPPLADEQNAALLIIAAAKLMPADPDSGDVANADGFVHTPPTAEELAFFRQCLVSDAGALPLLRRARGLPDARWPDGSVPSLGSLASTDQGNAQRRCATLLRYAALVAHADGRDGEALEYVGDIVALGEHTARQPMMFHSMVSTGIWSVAALTAGKIAHTLEVQPTAAGPGAATVEQIRELVARLCDDSESRRLYQRGIQGERSIYFSGVQSMVEDRPYFAAGILRGNKESLAAFDAAVAAAGSPDWAGVARNLPAMARPEASMLKPAALLGGILLPGIDRAHGFFRGVTLRRCGALALAIRGYQVRHGKMPEQLNDLVPEFLGRLPADPFDPAGGAIRYCAGADARLYSLNMNMKDDGGSAVRPDEKDQWKQLDWVMFLNEPTTRVGAK